MFTNKPGVHPKRILEALGIEVVAKQLPVHHKMAQRAYPQYRSEPWNMITLCWVCHRWFGHLHGVWKDHNTNLLLTIQAVRKVFDDIARSFNASVPEVVDDE